MSRCRCWSGRISAAFAVLVSLLLVPSTPYAQKPAHKHEVAAGADDHGIGLERRIAGLERAIPALMDSGQVAGLSIALVEDGQVVWARGYGVREIATGAPVDDHTVFEAASLTKPVFAYAVLQLVDRGVLELDRPLAEYLPYEDIAYDERYTRITARHVLSHTPGFPNWRPKDQPLTIDFEPGTAFSYSGEGYVYLQKVVEHLTGEPVEALVARTVLEPLGMTLSSFVWEDRFAWNVAIGHTSDGEPIEKVRPEHANVAWSLHTTARDYARFLAAVMDGERLEPATARAMLEPQIDVDDTVTWGLGVGLQQSAEGPALWHWGHNWGYRAYAVGYPESRRAAAWFINSNNGMLILDALLERTVGGDHPAARWLDYEQYDAPSHLVELELERMIHEHGIDAGLRRYRELKRTRPPEAFEESMLNSLGYRLLREDRVEDAIEVFKLNVDMYPDAWNPYDSLGEAYMAHGDLELAVLYYEKSVELNPKNNNGRNMLKRLRERLAEQQVQ